jgi:hypothetical protein
MVARPRPSIAAADDHRDYCVWIVPIGWTKITPERSWTAAGSVDRE